MRRSLAVLALVALGATVAQARGSVTAGAIVVGGSGTNLPITRRLADAFMRTHRGVTIEVPASLGSTGGIKAAADRAIAIGLTSRPLRGSETTWGLTVLPYARTPVVIGAHLSVPDEGLTFGELVQIYRGTKTKWRDGRPVVVLMREPGDSGVEVLQAAVPGFSDAYAESIRANRWTVLFTDQDMNRVLAKTPDAIGQTDAGAISTDRLPVKALRLNGVAPTRENVRNGTYGLVKTLALVFMADRLPSQAKAFIEFVGSAEGARVLAANGYLPAE